MIAPTIAPLARRLSDPTYVDGQENTNAPHSAQFSITDRYIHIFRRSFHVWTDLPSAVRNQTASGLARFRAHLRAPLAHRRANRSGREIPAAQSSRQAVAGRTSGGDERLLWEDFGRPRTPNHPTSGRFHGLAERLPCSGKTYANQSEYPESSAPSTKDRATCPGDCSMYTASVIQQSTQGGCDCRDNRNQ